LPFTGLDVAAIALVGGALVAGGTVLVFSSRKRHSTIA
jgi:LPXTG-motif cell wall-anchored protein